MFWLCFLPSLARGAGADGPTPPEGYVDRSGLTELVVWQAVNGLFAGVMLSSAAVGGLTNRHCVEGDSDSQACRDSVARATGITLVSLAAGIATPVLVTRGRAVRTADAVLVNRATAIGAAHGYVIPFAAGLKPLEDGEDTELDVERTQLLAGFTFLGDVLGVGAGAYLAHEYDPDPGMVSFLGTLHTTTFLAAFSIGSSFPEDIDQRDMRIISGTALAAADLALLTGLYFKDQVDVGRNRVFWIDSGALVGWVAGLGVGSIVAGEEDRAAAIGATLGMTAGIITTYLATADSEAWRNRAELASSGDGLPFTLEPPGLGMAQIDTPAGPRPQWVAELLKGRF